DHLYVAKINSDGNVGWSYDYPNSDNSLATSLAVDAQDNCYVHGYTWTGSNNVDLIYKFSSSGVIEWTVQDTITGYLYPDDIKLDANNNVIVDGENYNGVYVSKYDNSGNQLWTENILAISVFLSGGEMAIDDEGNIILLTLSNSGDYWENYHYTTVKYSPQGILQWYADYDNTYSDYTQDYLLKANFDSHGNVIVVGTSSCDDGCDFWKLDVFKFKKGELITCSSDFTLVADTLIPHHYWLIGEIEGATPIKYLWSWGDGSTDTLAYPSHTYDTAGFYTICLFTEDATGCVDSVCVNYELQKTEEVNTIISVNVVDSIPGVPVVIPDMEVLQSWSLYPNPSPGNVAVNYYLAAPAKVDMEVFDVLGNKLQNLSIEAGSGVNSAVINSDRFPGGIYYLKITAAKQVISGKFVIVN
ncbi:MAG TPA: T9SS type A sorting domain-containing protein, partial [Chitinophagales bacterium]|nr:T9SS type A sorting domain-containing protein [Chitinophagales bacterium]